MIEVYAKDYSTIPIGKQGEDRTRVIIFDLRSWVEELGEGDILLLAQRNGESAPYPCTVTFEDGIARWTVRAADVDKPGVCGAVELIYTVDGRVAKSESFSTFVAPALGGAIPEAPSPEADWVQNVLNVSEDVRRAADLVVDAPENARIATEGAERAEAARIGVEEARDAAKAAQTAAETARAGAEEAQAGAEAAQAGSEAAKDAAEAARNGSETAKAGAEEAKAGADAAQAGAETAKDAAEAAQNGAETARAGAEEAKAGAETARTGAEAARAGLEEAQAAAEAAQAAAEIAQAGSEDARIAAEAAQTGAETARTGAEAAQAVAETSLSGAEEAQNRAETAQTAAEAAKAGAEEAEASAEAAQAAAETAKLDAENYALSAAQSADTAMQYSGKPAIPVDETWRIWNAESGQYEDSGMPSRGEIGPQGPAGPKDNELAAAVFLAFSTGQFETTLTTHDGEEICTHEGVPINAWTKFGGIN